MSDRVTLFSSDPNDTPERQAQREAQAERIFAAREGVAVGEHFYCEGNRYLAIAHGFCLDDERPVQINALGPAGAS